MVVTRAFGWVDSGVNRGNGRTGDVALGVVAADLLVLTVFKSERLLLMGVDETRLEALDGFLTRLLGVAELLILAFGRNTATSEAELADLKGDGDRVPLGTFCLVVLDVVVWPTL